MWRILFLLAVLAAAAAPAAAQEEDEGANEPPAAEQPGEPAANEPARAQPADQPPEAQPPAAPAGADGVKATVVSVSGQAQKLTPGANAPWQDLTAGEQLDEQTVIRTGLGSTVVLKFADRGEVTLNRATKMGIGEFSKRGNATKARLGLKYGRVRAKVETTAGPSDFQISTPVATLSVRGSGANVTHMGLQTRASSFQGSWGLMSLFGSTVLSGGQSGNNSMTPWRTINTGNVQVGLLGGLHGLSPLEGNFLLFNSSGLGLPAFVGPFGNPSGPIPGGGGGQYLDDYWDYLNNGEGNGEPTREGIVGQ